MNDDDLDLRLTDALTDAASSTPHDPDALGRIMRRAAARQPRQRRTMIAAVSLSLVALGTAGIVASRSGQSDAPAAGNPDEVSAVPAAATTIPEAPRPQRVDTDFFYDDATLLSQLFGGFNVADLDDQSRMRRTTQEVEIDDGAMAQCMSEKGFEYFPQPLDDTVWTTHPRYMMSAVDFAAQYGFGLAAEALGVLPSEYTQSSDEQNDYEMSLGDRQQAYFQADSDCRMEHSNIAEIGWAGQEWVNAHDYAWTQFKPVVLGDDRVVAALADWQACMAAAGFNVDDPATITQPIYRQLYDYAPLPWPIDAGTPEYEAVETIMSEEIAEATANATCIAPYDEVLHQAVIDHFDEYKTIFGTALESGVESDANG